MVVIHTAKRYPTIVAVCDLFKNTERRKAVDI
jgi:hypothetical protein